MKICRCWILLSPHHQPVKDIASGYNSFNTQQEVLGAMGWWCPLYTTIVLPTKKNEGKMKVQENEHGESTVRPNLSEVWELFVLDWASKHDKCRLCTQSSFAASQISGNIYNALIQTRVLSPLWNWMSLYVILFFCFGPAEEPPEPHARAEAAIVVTYLHFHLYY